MPVFDSNGSLKTLEVKSALEGFSASGPAAALLAAGSPHQLDLDTLNFESEPGTIDLAGDDATIPISGVWLLSAEVEFITTTGSHTLAVNILKNGGVIIEGDTFSGTPGSGLDIRLGAQQSVGLVSGDVITVEAAINRDVTVECLNFTGILLGQLG